MSIGDFPVQVSSQEGSYRERITLSGGIGPVSSVGDPWFVSMLPRQFLSINQTVGGLACSVLVEWAIRDSATAGTPEWLPLQTIATVPGGATPVNTLLTSGAVWLRFTVTGVTGDVVEFACTSFV